MESGSSQSASTNSEGWVEIQKALVSAEAVCQMRLRGLLSSRRAFQTELDVVIDERRVPPLGGVQLGVGQGLAAAELLAGRVDAAGVEGLPVGKQCRGGGGVGEDHRAGRCPDAGGG
jgi:hypothetical protein